MKDVDYILIFNLVNHIEIQMEEKPDHPSIVEHLKEAVEEIKMAEAGKLKLQNARDLINEF